MVMDLGITGLKYCKFCDTDKPPVRFSQNTQTLDELTTKNKDCVAKYNRARNPAHR